MTTPLVLFAFWQAKLELQFDMETEAGKIGPVEKVGRVPAFPGRPRPVFALPSPIILKRPCGRDTLDPHRTPASLQRSHLLQPQQQIEAAGHGMCPPWPARRTAPPLSGEE